MIEVGHILFMRNQHHDIDMYIYLPDTFPVSTNRLQAENRNTKYQDCHHQHNSAQEVEQRVRGN